MRKCHAMAWSHVRAVTDWRMLLADARIDIVSITTPNNLHREMALALLAAGKHVWCGKPMALTLDDAQPMAAGAASRSWLDGR